MFLAFSRGTKFYFSLSYSLVSFPFFHFFFFPFSQSSPPVSSLSLFSLSLILPSFSLVNCTALVQNHFGGKNKTTKMILSKSFTSSLFFLAYIISIVLAQTTPSEINNSTEIRPITTTAAVINGTESITSTIVPTITTSTNPVPPSTPTITSPHFTTTTTNNNVNAAPTVQSTGWNSNSNSANSNNENWLRQHNRFVFIIFIGLLFLGLLIWYIVRSVKGMRKRLEQDNQAQLYMMQQASGGHHPPPPPSTQQQYAPPQQPYYPPPSQQQQQQQYNIPEATETPPPAYKTEANTPASYPPPPHN